MKKKMPSAAVILLVIFLAAAAVTWIVPSVSFETVFDEALGYAVIDQASVTVSSNNRVMPWQLPGILIEGVGSVLSTLVLICVCNGAVSVLTASGMFHVIIRKLCRRFRSSQRWLLLLIFLSFSCLGLVVIPHCFVPFVPLVISLAVQLGYDPLVGLAMVLFGATTASLSGPINAVTAMCQESVGLPIYSGAGVRFLVFGIYVLITALYLLRYAERVRRDPEKSLLHDSGIQVSALPEEPDSGEGSLSVRHYIALAEIVGVFSLIILGSTLFGFSTNDISSIFLIYALAVGPVLGFRLTQTIRHFENGIRASASTIVVISLAGAVMLVLKKGGIFQTVLYYTSSALSVLPGFLVPTALLLMVSLFNCLLPSGPAKGVLLMPLLGPAAQLSGVTMQTSVLTYTLGDSFSNYLLPYDSTTASYLGTAGIPFRSWLRFVWKLFLIWNAAGVAILTTLYFTGYGPF